MSTKINSFDELKQYRENLQNDKTTGSDKTEIRVAMATCAIATGSNDVLDIIEDAVEKNNLENVDVKITGCMGYCYAEPTVEVIVPGKDPVMYGPVDDKTALNIVLQHVMNGEIAENQLKTCHVNA